MLCFRKFPVAKNFMDEVNKGAGKEEVSEFSIECFLCHRAENFVKEPFSVSENFWHRKMLGINHKNNWNDRDSNPEPTA